MDMDSCFDRKKRVNGRRHAALACSALLLAGALFAVQPAIAHKSWPNSPLTDDMQVTLERAGRYAKSGKYQQAAQVIDGVLSNVTDVPKCLAIADFTDKWGTPMMETRRNCLNKALSLAGSREDMILVALKSRQFQFFEITRQAVNSLIGNAKTVPDLFDLAKKAHEVALNDVAHLAMEKAYTGVRNPEAAAEFAARANDLGMEDLVRKDMKDLIDDTGEVGPLCDYLIQYSKFNYRDLNRYGLRKALDASGTIPDMQAVYEVAVRLNEPDIANRANYFVRKGKVIQQIKEDRAAYQAKLRAWSEGVQLDDAAARDAVRESGGNSSSAAHGKPAGPPGSGF